MHTTGIVFAPIPSGKHALGWKRGGRQRVIMKQAMMLAIALWIGGGPAGAVGSAADIPIRVTGNRVNIRARPGGKYEVVAQAGFRDVLAAKALGDEWVEIYPPEGIRVWVHREYVQEGRVSAPRLNLRCGPGINYSVVGQLVRNQTVSPEETFGEWFALEAPRQCSFWISREFVEPLRPEPPPVAAVSSPPEMAGAKELERPVAPPSDPAPAPLARAHFPSKDLRLLRGLHLVPQPGQGRPARREGVILPVSYLLGRPSRFRLADAGASPPETLCYLIGEDAEFQRLIQRSARVQGREYAVGEARHPVLIVDQIDVE
jgi:hypothetical protein